MAWLLRVALSGLTGMLFGFAVNHFWHSDKVTAATAFSTGFIANFVIRWWLS